MVAEDEAAMPQSNAPTSWRDVYQLVQDAERRLTVQITDGFIRAGITAADHEVRIRVLETTDTKQRGAVATISAGQKLIFTLISLISLVIAVAGFFAK